MQIMLKWDWTAGQSRSMDFHVEMVLGTVLDSPQKMYTQRSSDNCNGKWVIIITCGVIHFCSSSNNAFQNKTETFFPPQIIIIIII